MDAFVSALRCTTTLRIVPFGRHLPRCVRSAARFVAYAAERSCCLPSPPVSLDVSTGSIPPAFHVLYAWTFHTTLPHARAVCFAERFRFCEPDDLPTPPSFTLICSWTPHAGVSTTHVAFFSSHCSFLPAFHARLSFPAAFSHWCRLPFGLRLNGLPHYAALQRDTATADAFSRFSRCLVARVSLRFGAVYRRYTRNAHRRFTGCTDVEPPPFSRTRWVLLGHTAFFTVSG